MTLHSPTSQNNFSDYLWCSLVLVNSQNRLARAPFQDRSSFVLYSRPYFLLLLTSVFHIFFHCSSFSWASYHCFLSLLSPSCLFLPVSALSHLEMLIACSLLGGVFLEHSHTPTETQEPTPRRSTQDATCTLFHK